MTTLLVLVVLLLLLFHCSSVAYPRNSGHEAKYEAFTAASPPSNLFFLRWEEVRESRGKPHEIFFSFFIYLFLILIFFILFFSSQEEAKKIISYFKVTNVNVTFEFK